MRLRDPAAALPSEQEQSVKSAEHKALEVDEALRGEPYTHQVGLHAGYTWCELSLSNNLSVVGFISPLSGRNIILVTCPFCLARYDEWEARNLPLRA